jgi:hypothetical protein
MDLRKAGVERPLALMAGRAVLRVDVIHRHFEHVVAADADAMNFYWWLFCGFRSACRLRRLRIAHKQILSRARKLSSPSRTGGRQSAQRNN